MEGKVCLCALPSWRCKLEATEVTDRLVLQEVSGRDFFMARAH